MAFRWVRKVQREPPICPAFASMTGVSTDRACRITTVGQIANELMIEMARNGFTAVRKNDVDEAAWATGKWERGKTTGVIRDNEVVYNLGLGRGRSNFFVFTQQHEGALEIFYSRARSDEMALTFTKEELFVHRFIPVGELNPEKAVKEVVGEILKRTGEKWPEDMRMQTHHHTGYLFERDWRMADDGISNIADIIRKAMLYHTDVWNPTPHNSSDTRVHMILDAVCRSVGMLYVSGTEITASLSEREMNGPHIVVGMGGFGKESPEKMIKRAILSKRNPRLQMQSYFQGLSFEKIFDILKWLKQQGLAFFGFAHEVNFNSRNLPIVVVGLLSALEDPKCPYTLEQTLSLMRMTCAVAAFNPSIDDSDLDRYFDRVELKGWLYALISRYDLGTRLTANAANLAVARWAEEELGIGSFYESDEHGTTKMTNESGAYEAGGDGFAKGFTRIKLKESAYKLLVAEKRLPTAEELVRWICSGEAQLHAKVFYQIEDETTKIVPGRTESPKYTKFQRLWLKAKQGWHYFGSLLHDAIYFARHGDFRHLFAMDK